MKRKLLLAVCFLLASISTYSQESDGYWDFTRAVEQTFPLAYNARTWHRIDLPTGTTQVIYRISFLSPGADATDKIASTLYNAPSLTVKGAAMAISIINSLGGTNKAIYHVFTSYEDADYYLKNENHPANNACYSSAAYIPGEKNFLTIDKGECIKDNTTSIWFAFHNLNSWYDEEVLLEVVPWVDNEASRGWTIEIKNSFMNDCIKQLGNEVTLKKEVCNCMLDKFQANYKVQDFSKFTQAELEKMSTDFGEECLKGTGEEKNILIN